MARTLSSISVQAKMSANVGNSLDGGNAAATVSVGQTVTPSTSQANGTGANQSDRFWGSQGRALSSGSSETIDVYDFGTIDIGAGPGKDALGQSLALAEITGLLIRNLATSAGNLIVGGDGTTACWNSIFNGDDDAAEVIKPGGFKLIHCPADPAYAVADGTNHLLKLAANGGAVQYDIQIMGRSA